MCVFFAVPAWACSCIGTPSPCIAAGQSAAVFVGTVTEFAEPSRITRLGRYELTRRTARFRVSEVLSGIPAWQKEIAILTGHGGGDCGFRFEPGTTYVVYAYRNRQGDLETGICSRTREISSAAEDLDYIRRNANAGDTGEIRVRTGLPDKPGPGGQRISLERAGSRYVNQTDPAGVARFSALPAGEYVVHADADGDLRDDPRVQLGAKGCAELSLRRSLVISGLVTTESGKPAAQAEVHARLTSGAPAEETVTARDGRYELRIDKPGDYLVGVNLNRAATRDSPYPRWFHPGTAEQSAATVVSFAGKHEYRTLDLRLPPAQPARVIEGIALKPDGQPAPLVQLTLADGDGNIIVLDSADPSGRFRLSASAGNAYRLHATSAGDPAGRFSAPPTDIAPGFELVGLKLFLTQPGTSYMDEMKKRAPR